MNLFKNVHESWIPLLHSLAYRKPMVDFIESLRDVSYQPAFEEIFRVFEMPLKDIKVVILGQEPYPRPGDAIGKAYAIPKNGKITNVLSNIKKEITLTTETEIMEDEETWKTLNHWSEQGVFLLNSALTVEIGNAGGHIKIWKEFIKEVISYISYENPCIWMLWGISSLGFSTIIKNPLVIKGYDKDTIKEVPIDSKINYIIPGQHPSAINLGQESFSIDGFNHTNVILKKRSLKKIIW